jgi:hypothetical protein
MVIEEPLDGDALPLLGDRCLYALDSIISDIIPAEAKDQTLDDPAGSSQEVRVVPPLRLRESIEGLLEVALVGLLEELVGRVCIHEAAVEDGEDGVSHGRCALVGDAYLVIGKITLNLLHIGDDL